MGGAMGGARGGKEETNVGDAKNDKEFHACVVEARPKRPGFTGSGRQQQGWATLLGKAAG